jgi:hypothetical protein
MSAKRKMRMVWLFPAVVVASWLTVRTLAASADTSPPTSPAATAALASADAEIGDPSLRRLIAGFADAARARQSAAR